MPLAALRKPKRTLRAVGITVTLLALVAAACSSDSVSSDSTSGASSTAADGSASSTEATGAARPEPGEGTPGGTLTIGVDNDLIPANLFTNSNNSITTLIGLVYEPLIRYQVDKLEPQPSLATAWTVAPDGLSIELTLRRGVTFHSGREFTSKDVEFSFLQVWADVAKWRPQQGRSFQAVERVDTTDPYKAVLYLKHPLSNLFDILDTAYIVDSETFAAFEAGTSFIGTGPFRFVSWTPNTELIFEKNPNYWVPDRPFLDGVRVTIVADATTRLAQLKSGALDFARSLTFRDIESLSNDADYSVIDLSGAELQMYVGATLQVPALADVRLRQAIAYALDRERIVTEVFRNSGYPVNLPWPKHSVAYDEERNTTYSYDPEKARALVAQIGTIPEFPLTFVGANPVYAATAQIVQANLADVGIPLKLDPVDAANFVSQLIGAEFKGLWTTYHSWAQHTPSTLTVSAYPFNADKNASHFVDATYQKNSNDAWQLKDGTSPEAIAAYSRISDDLLNALFLIEIGVVVDQWVTASNVKGVWYTRRMEPDVTNAYLD